MNRESGDFFWPSYVDLLTGLFIIMLVLFILSYKSLSDSKKASEDQLKKIQEIQNSVKNLPEKYFHYQEEYKRFALTQNVQFNTLDSNIPHTYDKYLMDVGTSLTSMIDNLKKKYSSDKIKYLVVIEGMASKDNYGMNYELSYKRSKALFDFWKKNQINFDPNICEIIIAGSGTGGAGRDSIEYKNQRFLIQIIPKISKLQ